MKPALRLFIPILALLASTAACVDDGTESSAAETTQIGSLESADEALWLDVIFIPGSYPNIRSVTIRNDGALVDLSGWTLASVGDPDLGFVFPENTTLGQGEAVGVVQQNARPYNCPDATRSTFFVCYSNSGAMYPGRGLVLLDSGGALVAEWDPPTGGPSDGFP